ncbi:DUF2577 domain-containing protein [Brevibacillus sp. Leaf182]|uniref:DUF2577 domain-containing protein n=1 Tax=Brevibacillus sp. Leaf182 TaxID=1736290 RepID=UPI0006F60CE8|nr:DUF2577 domain-containing protein [Brevibacillus sp. Leaf182]RAT95925.1 DUF2577 domain-containing protein [Brevibacillus sp. Leaf182]
MNGFQKLAHVLSGANQKQGTGGTNPPPKDIRIELATVIKPPPDLKILIDGMTEPIGKEFITVLEHLTRHTRIVTITHQEKAERDLGDMKKEDFLDTDDVAAPFTSFKHNYLLLQFEDVLKLNDKVHVLSVDSAYYILDRVKRP